MKLRQAQWNWIFDRAFAYIVALGYGAVFGFVLTDTPWWIISLIVGHEVSNWHTDRPGRRWSDQ